MARTLGGGKRAKSVIKFEPEISCIGIEFQLSIQ